MQQPSQTLSSIVKQTGLEELASAVAVDRSPQCNTRIAEPSCQRLAEASAHQQLLADLVAIGFALFVAVLVGRIAVTFVGLFGSYIKRQRSWSRSRTQVAQAAIRGGLLDG